MLIYDFHREQARERWLNTIKNGARIIKARCYVNLEELLDQEQEKN